MREDLVVEEGILRQFTEELLAVQQEIQKYSYLLPLKKQVTGYIKKEKEFSSGLSTNLKWAYVI